MRLRPTTRRFQYLVAAMALAAAATLPVVAQTDASKTTASPVLEKMKAELGKSALDYWVPRLNAYKVKIDRVLTPSDLAELNKLRVRFSILIGDELKGDDGQGRGAIERNNGAEQDLELDIDGMRGGEILEIYGAVKELAARNNDGLSDMGELVVGDFVGFAGVVSKETKQFIETNKSEIAADAEAKVLLDKGDDIDQAIEPMSTPEGRQGLVLAYSFIFEPMIMLYDGSDLNNLLQQAGVIGKPVTGLLIPESPVLKQNFPNPASRKTTITYNLTEPSGSTLLRLYDATGKIVTSLDEGSRSAGEHQVTIDVSKLAAGTYLYHLTIQTPSGEQVFSKTMQVVR